MENEHSHSVAYEETSIEGRTLLPVFEQEYFLSAGETDAEGKLSLTALTARIIDIATEHANSLGIGNPAMEPLQCGWVLSRLSIEMELYPHANEQYKLSTWVESWNRHFSERCFMVSDRDGNVCGYARSVWMVLSTLTRESVGLSHLHLPEGIVRPGACPMARAGKHLPVVESEEDEELPKGTRRATTPARFHTFGYSDLDFYRHVNTVRYVALLLNQYTLEEFDSSSVRRLELSFMREIRAGVEIRIERADSGSVSDFTFYDPEGTAHLLARMVLFHTS